MSSILKKGSDHSEIEKLNKELGRIKSKKGLNAKKYCGTVKIKEDGLVLQKRLRDEWE
jgi:hypothetical protein